MRKLVWFLAIVATLCVAQSCNKQDIDVVKNTTLSCFTQGFVDGATSTPAVWEENEQICICRAEDWYPALMSLTTGAESDASTFNGNIAGTKLGYYAVRPAKAMGAVTAAGKTTIKVEPNNIFFDDENSSVVVPQIGVGTASLTFTSLFGVLKFDVAEIGSIAVIMASIPRRERGLYGQFSYDFKQNTLSGSEVEYEVTRICDTPVETTSINVALPAGIYNAVELIISDNTTGKKWLYSANSVDVRRNQVTSATNVVPTEISFVVGSWRLKSLCGEDVQGNLYIKFDTHQTFSTLQYTELEGYKRYTGAYSIDSATSTISGEYSDGEKWGDSYIFSMNENSELVMQGVSSGDISIYEAVNIPNVPVIKSLCGTALIKKPL